MVIKSNQLTQSHWQIFHMPLTGFLSSTFGSNEKLVCIPLAENWHWYSQGNQPHTAISILAISDAHTYIQETSEALQSLALEHLWWEGCPCGERWAKAQAGIFIDHNKISLGQQTLHMNQQQH